MKLLTRIFAALALTVGAAHAQNISIATGGTGGVYYPLGGGMAAVLSKYVDGMQATAEVTGGSVANLQLISTGKPYIALSMTDAALDALKGEDNLKGKRVSTGSGGSATEVMAFRVIEAAGLDKDRDLRRERLGVAESVAALKDRKIDGFFWVGGLPTAAVTDLANSPGVKIKMIDHAELVPAMNKKYGELYVKDTISKDVYKGMDRDNKQATVMNLLVAHQNMDEKTAYNIVKAIFDHRDELIRVHKEAENFKLENQKKDASPLPWHPGAVKYFAEKGVKLN